MYGIPEDISPAGWLTIRMDPESVECFSNSADIGPEDFRWHERGGRRIPTLFTERGEPDPVVNAFFWLSGSQERIEKSRDRHGRFTRVLSLQEKLGIGDDAPVDDMRDILADRLRHAGIQIHPRRWGGREWALCPTFDVDYLNKWRPGIIWRESVQNLVLNYRSEPLNVRTRRFGSALADILRPGDPFRLAMDRIPEELERVKGTSTWFFKAGAHGPRDVGYRLHGRVRRRLAWLRAAGHEIGLHPAYHAYAHGGYMQSERDRLERAMGEAPRAVRMHFLRWQTPETPRLASNLGFRIDSTLGFPDDAGFRHGTTMPFRIWDGASGVALDLWEMPLAIMESALFVRQGLDASGAMKRTARLAETARRHGGVLVALWHTTLWDEVDFPGWGDHFVQTVEAARSDDAGIAGLSAALSTWAAG